jgi:hypothetical protein
MSTFQESRFFFMTIQLTILTILIISAIRPEIKAAMSAKAYPKFMPVSPESTTNKVVAVTKKIIVITQLTNMAMVMGFMSYPTPFSAAKLLVLHHRK